MPAPEGYKNFDVIDVLVNIPRNEPALFSKIYPNPVSVITLIPLGFNAASEGRIFLFF